MSDHRLAVADAGFTARLRPATSNLTPMSVIETHPARDWCHVCGHRRDHSADVWFPPPGRAGGAEHVDAHAHAKGFGARPPQSYIRVCSNCAAAIATVAAPDGPSRVVTDPPKRRRRR
jgi:hypothetical protein